MENILVPVDFSPVTSEVVEQASLVARAFGARVRVLFVAPPDPDFVGFEAGPGTVRDRVAAELREEHRALETLARELEDAGVRAEPLFVHGPTVETILRKAGEVGADLVVMGSHGHGALHRLLVGSVSEGVLRGAPCPVLVVPSPRG